MLTTTIKLLNRVFAIVSGMVLFPGIAVAHHLTPSLPQPAHSVAVERVQLPADVREQALFQLSLQRLALRQEMRAVKVAVQRQHSLQVSHISWTADSLVVTGHRLVRRHNDGAPATMWLEQVRVTVPRQHVATSWDVNALQKELERLGIKIKPKPSTPKPSQISG